LSNSKDADSDFSRSLRFEATFFVILRFQYENGLFPVEIEKQTIMRKIFISLLLLMGLAVQAQTPRDIMSEPIPVAMFQATYAFHIPALDLKEMYGVSHTIGGSFVYKTESNWMFTANGNFIFGNQLKGDRIDIFGEGITTVNGEITGGSGLYATFAIYQRGVHFQAEAGKLFPFWPNPNSGIFVQAGLGYLRNWIKIDYDHNTVNTPYVVNEEYAYGYDRMRGGPALHLETGYLYLGNSRILNFSVSFEVTYARVRDLREYDFRVFDGVPVGYNNPNATGNYVAPGRKSYYNDLYYGIRVSWNIPTYERKPEEFYYN
jgi:hypothetical protein